MLRVNNQEALRIEPVVAQSPNLIGGYSGNSVTSGKRGATIAGGGTYGAPNLVSGNYGTVGGGNFNSASSIFATVSGGGRNTASGDANAIGGGILNSTNGVTSTVAGGMENTASADNATVSGGYLNVSAGVSSTVSGGSGNCAGGLLSWAGGFLAKVRPAAEPADSGSCSGLTYPGGSGDEGTFVWADGQGVDFVSTGPNQFLIRAQGGVAINTNTPEVGAALTVAGNAVVQSPGALSFGSATRQMLNLFGTSYGIGVQSDTQYFRSGGNGYFAWFRGGVHSNTGLDPGAGGSLLMTLGPAASTPTGTARAQSFTNVSDRASKTGFEPIDASEVLARVTQLPLSQWSYRNEPSVRHLGPVAQDFRAAFGLGEDERTISTVDSAGVALAAIQGLNAKLEAENAALRDELAALRALIESRLPAER